MDPNRVLLPNLDPNPTPRLNAKASSYMASKDFQESKVHDPSMVNCDLVSMGDLLKRIDDRAFPGDFEILQG